MFIETDCKGIYGKKHGLQMIINPDPKQPENRQFVSRRLSTLNTIGIDRSVIDRGYGICAHRIISLRKVDHIDLIRRHGLCRHDLFIVHCPSQTNREMVN